MSAHMDGITNPPIDELLDKAGSKYSLVLYAAKRARQINAYYSQLGEGLTLGHWLTLTFTRSHYRLHFVKSTRDC